MGRFSDRALVRTYADNNLDLFDWLEKHGIKWEAYRTTPDRLDRSRTRLNVVRVAERGRRTTAAAPASCGRWQRRRVRWAWRSCSSTR